MHSTSQPGSVLRRSAPILAAALAVAAASGLAVVLRQSTASQLTLVPFAFVIASSVLLGGLVPGLAALALSTIAIDLLVVEPGTVFHFTNGGAAVVLGSFVAAWAAFCAVAWRLRRGAIADRESRVAAERVATRSDRVTQLTGALAQARTPAAAIEAALKEPLHALGADAGVLFLLKRDGSRADPARAIGFDDGVTHAPIDLREAGLATVAVGRGVPVIRDVPSGCVAMIPLLIGSRCVALTHLQFNQPREFSDDEREYLEVLATRAAQALDR